MATKSGRIAKVEYNGNTVAGQGTWTLSGFTREVIEEDSWDLDIKKKHFSVGDAGTITFSGLYDALDATGQDLLNSACLNSSAFSGGLSNASTLNFYVDNTSYWTVDTGGKILITKCESITLEKSSMGVVDFEAVVENGAMMFI